MKRSYRRRAETIGVRGTEAQLVEAILQTLNLAHPGTFCWRQETRGLPVRTKTGWQVRRNTQELGKADIAGVTNGYGWVIEVKLPGGYLKPHQRIWLEDYVKRGHGRAAVCHSVDEAEEFIMAVKTSGMADVIVWVGEIQ